MTPDQLREIRSLIETTGFLPMTNKADRLFAAAQANRPAEDLSTLKTMFKDAGYLPRSKALKLVELAGG
jgi:hypothetical protein